ncbi:isoprenylcysteine carboxylmethyltransferase family protein [Aeoliella sp. ICT_H6.2]|uniref:Isoprenylcysteine carboxylmethyltransferase family protein n=1 Tax=Aeoliella straminimaris TaxID=2954799 RepID=A0A9X2F730_9BACT|nr:isoprenylcysteine carboxylmethyltransferase family protein [Aeoliella straminimaris]MCO6042787.1 isoprenylcysteine carboxylmethyltransferase family protein [Aeoliella straminimaris]
MGIRSEMVRQGNWLFRWRSYLPIVFLIPLAIGIATMRWPFGSYTLHEYCEFVSLAVSVLGVVVRAITVGHTPVGTSGRNTHGQVAQSLNTTGIYATVRHPLYLGNFLIGLGVVMVPAELWLVLVYVLTFWLYYERIMAAEEAYLAEQFGEEFDNWAAVTPAFVPSLWRWNKPSLPFSLRNVLKREYTALALVVLCHSLIETLEHLVIDRTFKFESLWASTLALAVLGYFVLRGLKRHTELLQVEGR